MRAPHESILSTKKLEAEESPGKTSLRDEVPKCLEGKIDLDK